MAALNVLQKFVLDFILFPPHLSIRSDMGPCHRLNHSEFVTNALMNYNWS